MTRRPGPLVQEFFDLLDVEPRIAPFAVGQRTGLARGAPYKWRLGQDPALHTFEAALNAIGFHHEIVAGAPHHEDQRHRASDFLATRCR